jgi:hypothetical protein
MEKIISAKKGISGIIDVALFSSLIIVAIAFLQIYAVSHTSTSIKDQKILSQNSYAQNALHTLGYVTAKAASYDTVQDSAITNTSDPDLEALVNMSDKARNYSRSLDRKLENWSRNITAASDEITGELDEIRENITDLRTGINEKTSSLIDALNEAKDTCSDITDGLNAYAEIIGGAPLSLDDDPCDGVDESVKQVSNISTGIDISFADAEQKLEDIADTVNSNTEKALESITSARCILREVDVKLDRFTTYAQLAVKEDTTLIDLMPAKASLGTKSVKEVLSESLYVEDRLARSGLLETAGAFGARAAMQTQGFGMDDPKNQIAQGAVLTIIREDYRTLGENAVKDSLDKALTGQGYAYCFVAKTCCTTISAGSCENIPYGSGRAVQTLKTIENQTAQLELNIWRQ